VAFIPLDCIISVSDKMLVVDVQKAHLSIGRTSSANDETIVPRLTPAQSRKYNWKIVFLMCMSAGQASLLAMQDWENVFQALH
jgi:hypothetical protein